MKPCLALWIIAVPMPLYYDRFDGTSDMNAATQRPAADLGVSYATVFLIHREEK
jgi:hypothetical protein